MTKKADREKKIQSRNQVVELANEISSRRHSGNSAFSIGSSLSNNSSLIDRAVNIVNRSEKEDDQHDRSSETGKN